MLFKACVALCATFLAADVSAVGTIVKPTGIVQATLEYCSLAEFSTLYPKYDGIDSTITYRYDDPGVTHFFYNNYCPNRCVGKHGTESFNNRKHDTDCMENGITEAACVAMTIGPVCEWIVGTIDQAENAKGLLEANDGLETLVEVSTVDDP